MLTYYNRGSFQADMYNEDSIKKSVASETVQVEANQPIYVESLVQNTELEDETDYFQFWSLFDNVFSTTEFKKPESSSSGYEWPTPENPESFFKFSSFWLEQGQSMNKIERSTYGLLDWLGDVGGLYDGLYLLTGPLVSTFAFRALHTQLHYQINNLDKESNGPQKRCSLLELCCSADVFRGLVNKKYRSKLQKVRGLFNKDLDLIKYVTKKRRIWMATFAMLEKEHRLAIRDLSKL